MSWWMRVPTLPSAAATAVGIGQRLQEVAAHDPEDVEAAAIGGVHHLRRGEPLEGRAAETPTPLRSASRCGSSSARRAAHLGAALHAGVAADRHQADLLAADPAARQADVHERLDGLDAVRVLRQPHRPDEDPVLRVAQQLREALASPRAWCRSPPRAAPMSRRCGVALRLLEAARVARAMNSRSIQPSRHQDLEDAVQEREVAAGVHGEPLVGEPACRTSPTRAPTAPSSCCRPGSKYGFTTATFVPPCSRVVQVLHGDRLVVGRVRAEEDDEVGARSSRV